jgi:hypothetical protein
VIYHHIDHYNTEIGGDIEVHCVYMANPQPTTIRWYRDHKQLVNETEKYHITNDIHNHKHRAKLLIKNVGKNDLKDYICEIEVLICEP